MTNNPTKNTTPAPIVCGTDFSKASTEVSMIAAMIANALGAPLKLAFARNWLADGATPDAAAAMDESYNIRLKEEVQKLEKTGADIEPIICQGSPSEALIQVATDQKAQLVILGWHSANSRWHVGSVPERAAAYSPSPVIVIQNPEKFKAWLNKERPLKIFVGTDFSHSSDTALSWVKTLSDIGPCDITATYIDKPSEEEKQLRLVKTLNISGDMQRVQNTLERDLHNKVFNIFGHDEVKTIVFGNWASKCCQLIMLAENDDADLIVIGTHQRLGINKLKKDSFSHDILRQSYTNVACVPSCTAKATVLPKIRECKRVLVAVDLKERHGFTAAHAYSIVDPGGTVTILHNSTPLLNRSGSKYTDPDLTPKYKLSLNELEPDEAAERQIITQIEVTEETNTAEAICAAAERVNADIICIGSHTRPGLTLKMLGSVALEVLQKSQRPVLLVQPPSTQHNP